VAKFFQISLADQILANIGEPLAKHLTSHVLRRTVATRLTEPLGDEGDKLVKRVLGHADESVTAICNWYGYVREMPRALASTLLEDGFEAPVPFDRLLIDWRLGFLQHYRTP
jgi:integrase